VNALRLLYRRRGHGAVRIQSAVIPEPGPAPVETTVRITITEGPRTTVGRILIAGNTAVDERVLRGVIGSEPGGPLFEPQIALDRDAVALQFLNRGYAQAEVSVEADLRRRAHPRRPDVHRAPGAAGVRRPRARGRQRAHQRRDDSPRADAQPRRSPVVRGHHREPAARERPRPVPPRAHHRDRPRRRVAPRPARHRRRSPGDDHRLRRRCRSRAAAAAHDYGRRPGRAHRDRPTRVLRDRAAQPVRRQPLGEPVHAREPPAAERPRTHARRPAASRRLQRVPRARHLPAAASHREHRLRGELRARAGGAHQLRLQPARRARRARAPPPSHRERGRALRPRAHRSLQRDRRQRRAEPHRSRLPAGAPVDGVVLVHPGHARRCARADVGRADRVRRRAGGPRDRVGGGVRQGLCAGLLLPAPARPPRRGARDGRARRDGAGIRRGRCGASATMQEWWSTS
jgi:hypothetical protein